LFSRGVNKRRIEMNILYIRLAKLTC